MLSLGLLYTLSSYAETGTIGQNQRAMTLKANGSTEFSSRFDGNLGGFATLFSTEKESGPEARFVGVNVRLGWSPFVSKGKTLRLTLYGGVYYATMLVEHYSYGYRDMTGPQILPLVAYRLSASATMSAYFKFAPVARSWGEIEFSNRELAVGGNLLFRSSGGTWIGAAVDYAQMSLSLPYNGQTVSIRSRTFSAGLVYGW